MKTRYFGTAQARGQNPALVPNPEQGPLRIGWFGALRCARSLKALGQLSDAMDGGIEVVLRGRPAVTEFDDFHREVDARSYMRFEGGYRNPDDLVAIYQGVHLVWAIDFFEAGQNSMWLLPNRLYEGCLHGAIPVALAGTETAAFIERLGIGIVLPDIEPQTLRTVLGDLAQERLAKLAGAVQTLQPSHFAVAADECRTLVEKLAELVVPTHPMTDAA
ncbi:hypothetical protein PSQ19_05500 [Devosia algicola]|uniref:Glycosyl transferase family 1 n=1 Tax=Devosia algicola TaxID=3026418 RepID=A0ABY7YQE3_9HYPH|nr:hypothetical protein [Devosia algicola]WDR03545.1 hypothetical protein PSQ19_05500 [Devosia algicola]